MEGQSSIQSIDPEWERRVYDWAAALAKKRRRERSWWTRLYCSLWWGHRPVRYRDDLDWQTDHLTCRCGRVTVPTEAVVSKLR